MGVDDFMSLVVARRSCRDYLDKAVPEAALAKCLEAARLAPSACNKQPWRFVLVTDQETRRRICGGCLLPGLAMPWLSRAPVLVALCVEEELLVHKFAPLLSGVKYPLVDAGIAGEHFVLAAAAQGLGTCWVGWFRPGPLKRLLGVPRRAKVVSLLSLGYPASEAPASSRLEMAAIRRDGRWG